MRRARLWAGLVLVAGLSLTGCGGSGSSVAAPGTIAVGSTAPLTGPDAPGQSEVSAATRAYFAWVDAHGGVAGHQLSYTVLNDAGSPVVALAATQTLVARDHVFAVLGAVGADTQEPAGRYLAAHGVPDLLGPGGFAPAPAVEATLLARWIVAQPGPARVGLLFRNDSSGRAAVAQARSLLPSGAVVSVQEYSAPGATLDGQIAALRADGASTVLAFTTPVMTAVAELDARALGWAPRWVVGSAGADPTAVGQALTALAVARGQVAALPSAATRPADQTPLSGVVSDAYLPAATDTANSWIAAFRRIWAASPTLQTAAPIFDAEVVQGMTEGELFTAALLAAGSHPTQAGLEAAVRQGLPAGPGLVPFGAAGYIGAQLVRWDGSTPVALGPPEVVAGGQVTASAGQRQTAPANGIPS